jgi:chemotaxis signal transduction protein
MRPLRIEPVGGTPGFVRGVSMIRGAPTPVVDLKALLENSENHPGTGDKGHYHSFDRLDVGEGCRMYVQV